MNLEGYAEPADMPANAAMRIARLLAIDGPGVQSDVQLAQRVCGGRPARSATALAEVIGRSRGVGPVVPEATLRRVRKTGKPLSRELSERLYEVGHVVDALGRAYHGEADAIDTFLHRPPPARRRDTFRHRVALLDWNAHPQESTTQRHRSPGRRTIRA